MKISMEEVKVLRAGTGAGVMDCKRALTEANGDKKEAAELLRKWGIVKADKIGTKIAAEGLCRIAKDGTVKAAVVEVNSETDFVAKNDKFRAFVEKAARQALDSEARDIDTFMAESWAEEKTCCWI